MKNVLPENLIYSLYREPGHKKDESLRSHDSTIRDIFSRLDANASGLDELSNLTNFNLDLDSINEQSMRDIIKKMDSMISKFDPSMVNETDKTLPLKIKDKLKIKDFNVNINLNLRVMKEEKGTSSTAKIAPVQKTTIGISRSPFEEKRKTSDSIKLIQEIKEKFKKKTQPNQITSSNKGSIDREYKIGSDPYKVGFTSRRLGGSSKDTLVTNSKAGSAKKEGLLQKFTSEISKETSKSTKQLNPSLKIKNFDKVGSFYKLFKVSEGGSANLGMGQPMSSRSKINYEGLLAYTDRSHKRELKLSYKEGSSKKLPLTSREPTKSTTDFTKNKESEYILKGAKSNSNMASKKKLSIGSTEGLNFKRKKFSLQTTGNVGGGEKSAVAERPQTGSSLAAVAYGTNYGIFLKRSMLSNGTKEDQPMANKDIQRIAKKPNNGSLSSRTCKAVVESASLFTNAQTEYQRQTTSGHFLKFAEERNSAISKPSPMIVKSRFSKPEIKELSSKTSRVVLQKGEGKRENGLQSSGALTERTLSKDGILSPSGQKSTVLLRVSTANLVQSSKFAKHIGQASESTIGKKVFSDNEQKVSSKLIIINEDKAKDTSSKVVSDLLIAKARKSTAEGGDAKPLIGSKATLAETKKKMPEKKELKSIMKEISLIKEKIDRSTERPTSSNRTRKSPLNRKPLY